jgi:hypothetical protein
MAAEIDRAYAPYEMIKTDPPTIFSTELWARFAALAEFSKPILGDKRMDAHIPQQVQVNPIEGWLKVS